MIWYSLILSIGLLILGVSMILGEELTPKLAGVSSLVVSMLYMTHALFWDKIKEAGK